MEVRCEKCQARYRVDDARVGPQGLTMRCGKCQNVFKVTRAAQAAAAPEPIAPEPAPKAPPPKGPEANATMIFASAPGATPKAAPPSRTIPPASTPADEGAGRTMMFQTGNLKSSPGMAAPAKPLTIPPSSTMVFGQAPAKGAPGTQPKRPDDVARSTMMFGQAPAAAPRPTPTVPAREEPADEPVTRAAETPPADEPLADAGSGGEELSGETPDGDEAPAGRFDKAPPKGLLLGVAVGLMVLLLVAIAVFAVKKLGGRPPPQAAVEALSSAQALAEKDSFPALADAEAKIKEAIDAAGPKVTWPQARAALAGIEVQWADALNDSAVLWTVRAERAPDDARRGEAETRAQKAQEEARARLKTAFEIVGPALKAAPKSAELELALADYYRAQRSTTNMNRELRKAQALKADESRIQLIQGTQLAQEEDGGEKALPKLKIALAAQPESARLHFRLAMAYLSMKDDADAVKELRETLRLSPQHERAKLALEQATAPGPK